MCTHLLGQAVLEVHVLLGLLDPEDERITVLQNNSNYTSHKCNIPLDVKLQQQCCQNLKPSNYLTTLITLLPNVICGKGFLLTAQYPTSASLILQSHLIFPA